MKQDNQDLLSFIDSYFHFKEFQAKENIMEQMDSKKTYLQIAVNLSNSKFVVN